MVVPLTRHYPDLVGVYLIAIPGKSLCEWKLARY
jgi:hypothetical protein